MTELLSSDSHSGCSPHLGTTDLQVVWSWHKGWSGDMRIEEGRALENYSCQSGPPEGCIKPGIYYQQVFDAVALKASEGVKPLFVSQNQVSRLHHYRLLASPTQYMIWHAWVYFGDQGSNFIPNCYSTQLSSPLNLPSHSANPLTSKDSSWTLGYHFVTEAVAWFSTRRQTGFKSTRFGQHIPFLSF